MIKKLKEKKKKDPAHFTKKQLEQRDKKLLNDSIKEMNKKEKEEKKALIFLKKELKKYQTDKKELLKLKDAINDRFKVSETSTAAAEYGIAALYFDALEIHRLPKNYYPLPHADQHELFTPGEDYHYWLWNFQINTQPDRHGHTIPDRPGTTKEYVIHALLFPMTSTVIYLGKWNSEDPDSQFMVNWQPNDELFGREWLSNNQEDLFKTYEEALKCFYEFIEKHLDGDEERYYNQTKRII